ncbi:MAG: penicillin-binding protein activator LpoB [Elusimicrobiota bacterium]
MKSVKYIFAVLILLTAGCGGKKVDRIDTDVTIDLSGRWNDKDSQLVARALIEQNLSSGWAEKFKDRSGRKPVVIVGTIHNKTYEHINTQTFVKDLEQAMLNSGKVELVASADQREEVRSEREDMQEWASINTKKDIGQESGADFMLKGVLNSILDEEKGEKVVYYQADLNLINIENNNIIWSGQKKIRKYIKKPLFSF